MMSRPPGRQDGSTAGHPTQISGWPPVYTPAMAKHLIDLDESRLASARAELGTTTIKDTVNEALRLAAAERQCRVAAQLDTLAAADLDDREQAWR